MPGFKWAGDDVRELADDIISDATMHLTHLQGGKMPHFLLANKFSGQEVFTLCKVSKTSGLAAILLSSRLPRGTSEDFAFASECERFLVLVNDVAWRAMGPNEELGRTEQMAYDDRKQLLYHYLLRCVEDENGGLIVRKLVDYQFYTEEIKHYGTCCVGVKRLMEALTEAESGQRGLPLEEEGDFSEMSDPFLDANGKGFETDSDEEHAALMETRRKIEHGATDEDIAKARQEGK